jgi:hypothetical protein
MTPTRGDNSPLEPCRRCGTAFSRTLMVAGTLRTRTHCPSCGHAVDAPVASGDASEEGGERIAGAALLLGALLCIGRWAYLRYQLDQGVPIYLWMAPLDVVVGLAALTPGVPARGWLGVRATLGSPLVVALAFSESNYAEGACVLLASLGLLLLVFEHERRALVGLGAALASFMVLMNAGKLAAHAGMIRDEWNHFDTVVEFAGQPLVSGVVNGRSVPYQLRLPDGNWRSADSPLRMSAAPGLEELLFEQRGVTMLLFLHRFGERTEQRAEQLAHAILAERYTEPPTPFEGEALNGFQARAEPEGSGLMRASFVFAVGHFAVELTCLAQPKDIATCEDLAASLRMPPVSGAGPLADLAAMAKQGDATAFMALVDDGKLLENSRVELDVMLELAARVTVPGLCKRLIGKLPDSTPTLREEFLRVPLLSAVAHGNDECFHDLLRAGASPSAEGVAPDLDGKRSTALILSIRTQHPQLTKALLDAKADPSMRDENLLAPLHWAVGGQDLPTLVNLIAAGADVNALGPAGTTPLFHAVTTGTVEKVRALLEGGASPLIPNRNGATPESVAIAMGHEPIVELLRNPPRRRRR